MEKICFRTVYLKKNLTSLIFFKVSLGNLFDFFCKLCIMMVRFFSEEKKEKIDLLGKFQKTTIHKFPPPSQTPPKSII